MKLAWGGSVALMMLLVASSGCVGRRYVNRTLYGPTGQPRVHTEPMEVPDVAPETANAVQIAGAPTAVQANFHQDHRDAVVTNVEPVPAGNGLVLYRVSYIEDGAPGQAVYRAGGGPVVEPSRVYLGRDTREEAYGFRPRPTTGPTTHDVQ